VWFFWIREGFPVAGVAGLWTAILLSTVQMAGSLPGAELDWRRLRWDIEQREKAEDNLFRPALLTAGVASAQETLQNDNMKVGELLLAQQELNLLHSPPPLWQSFAQVLMQCNVLKAHSPHNRAAGSAISNIGIEQPGMVVRANESELSTSISLPKQICGFRNRLIPYHLSQLHLLRRSRYHQKVAQKYSRSLHAVVFGVFHGGWTGNETVYLDREQPFQNFLRARGAHAICAVLSIVFVANQAAPLVRILTHSKKVVSGERTPDYFGGS
jgi:hypothetical protein